MYPLLSHYPIKQKSNSYPAPIHLHNQTQEQEIFRDLAFGCIIGAMCGDAIGVPMEFKREVNLEQANWCLRLPGGGPFKLGKGQITDDSELTLCLAEGLVQGKGVLDLHKIGGMYHYWYLSRPFDIGITTRTAFKNAKNMIANKNHADVIRQSSLGSEKSQSNGALMRITPLCVWTSKLNREEIIKAVREETRLTHPNRTAQNVSIAYVYTINYLLNHPGENEKAYQKCKELVIERLGDNEIINWLYDLEEGFLPPANETMGWVKIAFVYSLYFLRKKTPYKEAMIEMLSQGGDTDTNCCIVGGMLGALHGLEGIPKDVRKQVLRFETRYDGGIQRPDYLTPGKCAEKLINEIIRIRPEKLYMKGEERNLLNNIKENPSDKKIIFSYGLCK